MLYFIQVTFYSMLFYGIYFLLLRNRMHHAWSRIYLLLCAFLPLLLPFLKISTQGFFSTASAMASQVMLPVFTITANAGKLNSTPAIISNILFGLYCLVTVGALLRLIISYAGMMRVIHRGAEEHEGIKLLYQAGIGPGSWRKYIFLPGNSTDTMILDHEMAHVKLRHSWDTDLMHLLGCFCWPNFILPFIAKELRIVHEFQADAYASNDTEKYAQLLLNQAFNTNSFLLSHTFFQHPLNRRIMMLKKSGSKSPKIAGIATFISALCLSSSIVFAQSISKQPVSATSQQVPHTTGAVLEAAEKMPRFHGSLNEYLAHALKYPRAAKDGKIQGKVMVKFVVNSDGDVVDPQIVKSPNNLLSAAALDAIKAMPKWEPAEQGGQKVSVYYHLPILFKL